MRGEPHECANTANTVSTAAAAGEPGAPQRGLSRIQEQLSAYQHELLPTTRVSFDMDASLPDLVPAGESDQYCAVPQSPSRSHHALCCICACGRVSCH